LTGACGDDRNTDEEERDIDEMNELGNDLFFDITIVY
jgi:hypothetical protein